MASVINASILDLLLDLQNQLAKLLKLSLNHLDKLRFFHLLAQALVSCDLFNDDVSVLAAGNLSTSIFESLEQPLPTNHNLHRVLCVLVRLEEPGNKFPGDAQIKVAGAKITVRNAEDYFGLNAGELAEGDSSLGVANIDENHVPDLIRQLVLHSLAI